MKINGIRCDNCISTHYVDENWIGNFPRGWFTLKEDTDELSSSRHFCSLNCLREWTIARMEKQPSDCYGVADTPCKK